VDVTSGIEFRGGVIAAVEAGEMSVSRYQNYLKMLESGAAC